MCDNLIEGASKLAAITFVGWVILLLLPLMVFGFFGFQKWKRHYPADNSVFSYFLRYISGKTATDDRWQVYSIKVGAFLVWFMIVNSIWR